MYSTYTVKKTQLRREEKSRTLNEHAGPDEPAGGRGSHPSLREHSSWHLSSDPWYWLRKGLSIRNPQGGQHDVPLDAQRVSNCGFLTSLADGF